MGQIICQIVRRFLPALALAASACTSGPAENIPGPQEPGHGESSADRSPTETELASAITGTVRAILDDLRGLAGNFTQLEKIASVHPGAEGFTYSEGLRTPIKLPNPKFDKNGCYIAVDIIAYRPEGDRAKTERLALSARAFQHYQLQSGCRYAVWTHVRAEPDRQGTAFEAAVRKVLSSHLDALRQQLGATLVPSAR